MVCRNTIRRDISCNLASLNIVNVMEHQNIRESVHVGMMALTAVSDMTNITNAPGVAKANREMHSVGLGAMNLHGFLAKNMIAYESEEALDFARTFFMMMNYYSLEASMLIAKEKGETFVGFEKSDYADGTYFERYVQTDYRPKTDKIKQLFHHIEIPSPQDWSELRRPSASTACIMHTGWRLHRLRASLTCKMQRPASCRLSNRSKRVHMPTQRPTIRCRI